MSSDCPDMSATLNSNFSLRKGNRVLVVSIDGVAPRFITPERMPNLTRLARSGGGCFTARTIEPPLTRPAHASMLRGVEPDVHGSIDNSVSPLSGDAPTFLMAARDAGLTTASFNNWLAMDTLIETKASTSRIFLDGGYDPTEDDLLVQLWSQVEALQTPAVGFLYLSRPDLAGHAEGWGSEKYYQALRSADRCLGQIMDRAEGIDLVVTTDHGGLGKGHMAITDRVMTTFITVRSNKVEPGSFWTAGSVLDIAPTVADLAGFTPHAAWRRPSLVGRQEPIIDHLMGLLKECERHTYGENVSMLAHSLQSAARMNDSGADDDLVLAALLHDIGHLLGPAGDHGYYDHAEAAADFLRPWLPTPIVEPIRLHVAAKRHLVASDDDYLNRLSEASKITLEQQGGPFTDDESAAFIANPHAPRSIMLRNCDDGGKQSGATVAPLEDYEPLLVAALAREPIDPSWARDACRCGDCRDPLSDQHLLDIHDLSGWMVLGTRRTTRESLVDLTKGGDVHQARIPLETKQTNRPTLWSKSFSLVDRRRAPDALATIASDVSSVGVAFVGGLSTTDGTVLKFAQKLGFVRETNYGRLFDVRTRPEAINLAYTPLALPLHTDNPYRDPVPTVQILHCRKAAASGGGTLLADGIGAAEALRQVDAESFEILTTTAINYRFHDATVDLRASRRTIDCHPDGSVQAVYLNHRSMDTPATEKVRAALTTFVDILKEFTVELTLADGEAIVFDNRRVLHARTGFDASSGRHLQGCYIDIDALMSVANVAALD